MAVRGRRMRALRRVSRPPDPGSGAMRGGPWGGLAVGRVELPRGRGRLVVALAVFLASAGAASPPGSSGAHAVNDPQDDILRSIGVDENPGGAVPLDALFLNRKGGEGRLGGSGAGGAPPLTRDYF